MVVQRGEWLLPFRMIMEDSWRWWQLNRTLKDIKHLDYGTVNQKGWRTFQPYRMQLESSVLLKRLWRRLNFIKKNYLIHWENKDGINWIDLSDFISYHSPLVFNSSNIILPQDLFTCHSLWSEYFFQTFAWLVLFCLSHLSSNNPS